MEFCRRHGAGYTDAGPGSAARPQGPRGGRAMHGGAVRFDHRLHRRPGAGHLALAHPLAEPGRRPAWRRGPRSAQADRPPPLSRRAWHRSAGPDDPAPFLSPPSRGQALIPTGWRAPGASRPRRRWTRRERWSLTSLRERLIKTGARMVRHARFAVFQMAEAALPRAVFAGALDLINGLRGPPAEAASS